MADVTFRGDAPAVAQLDTITIGGTWAGDDTATVTINGKAVTFTVVAGSTAISDVVAGLQAVLEASPLAEFEEINWVDASPDITCTAATAGVSFTIAVSKVSTSGTISNASTTGNDGPNVLSAANLSGGALPSATDNLILEDSAVDLLYALDAVTAALANVEIEASYTGNIGLLRENTGGDPDYVEYRTRELTLDVDNLIIGQGGGDGSGRIFINLGSTQTAVKVYKTGSADSADDLHALRIRGTHASNTISVEGDSSVDIAPEGGDTATFATINAAGNSTVRISDGTTWTTLNASGSANVEIYTDTALTDWTTINISGNATVTLYGDNDGTTVTITGNGSFDDRGSGTIGTLTKGPNATYTTENSGVAAGARVLTNTTIAAGQGTFDDTGKKVTFTNDIDLCAAGLRDFPNLNLGDNINIGRS